jgi:hypothetical protein
MSSDESPDQRHERIERQIAFIVDQQSKFLTDIEQLKDVQAQTSKDIIALAHSQSQTSEDVRALAGVVAELAQTVESQRGEMRDAIDKLIFANEGTRDLAEKAAQLAISASQRITKLEEQP